VFVLLGHYSTALICGNVEQQDKMSNRQICQMQYHIGIGRNNTGWEECSQLATTWFLQLFIQISGFFKAI
jgi:hypothetical protein